MTDRAQEQGVAKLSENASPDIDVDIELKSLRAVRSQSPNDIAAVVKLELFDPKQSSGASPANSEEITKPGHLRANPGGNSPENSLAPIKSPAENDYAFTQPSVKWVDRAKEPISKPEGFIFGIRYTRLSGDSEDSLLARPKPTTEEMHQGGSCVDKK